MAPPTGAAHDTLILVLSMIEAVSDAGALAASEHITIMSLHVYDIVPCAVVVLVNTVPLTFQLHVAVKSSPNTALITVVLLTYTLLMRVAVTLVPLISVAVGGVSMVHCILYMLLSRSVSGDTRCILTDVDTMIKTKTNFAYINIFK